MVRLDQYVDLGAESRNPEENDEIRVSHQPPVGKQSKLRDVVRIRVRPPEEEAAGNELGQLPATHAENAERQPRFRAYNFSNVAGLSHASSASTASSARNAPAAARTPPSSGSRSAVRSRKSSRKRASPRSRAARCSAGVRTAAGR